MKKITIAMTAVLGAILLTATAVHSQAAPKVIKADGREIDDVVADILVDSDQYNNQEIEIRGTIYEKFGFREALTFYEDNSWFEDSKTVMFNQTSQMHDESVCFYFQPASRDARKYVLTLRGKYYTAPHQISSIFGTFTAYKIPYGPALNVFLVRRLVVDGQTFEGTLPERISK